MVDLNSVFDAGPEDRLSRVLERGGVVKIDGLREPEHAAVAASAGADLLGFVFAPARRRVTAETARSCIEAAREAVTNRDFFSVGVFVDASADEIAVIVRDAGLDAVQLHGNESPELLSQLDVPAIKVFRPQPGMTAEEVLADLDRYRNSAVPAAGVLIDGYSEHAAGGAGIRADWKLAAAIGAMHGILLGGGLQPDNVGEAIRCVRPIGVDVSSGVERDGVKDPARIEAFIRAAREAFQS
ncbi:MAG: phosphoribosylanthranilate isomerase [Thermomicrobiales bacterium]